MDVEDLARNRVTGVPNSHRASRNSPYFFGKTKRSVENRMPLGIFAAMWYR